MIYNAAQVAPDLTPAEMRDIAGLALRLGIDGLVVGNTTISRPSPVAEHAHGGEVWAFFHKSLREVAAGQMAGWASLA